MQINSKFITPDLVEVNILFAKNDITSLFQKEINKAAKTASVKGFRKGKTPPAFIKKMMGPQLLFDMVNNQVMDSLNTYMKENNYETFGNPVAIESEQSKFEINPDNIQDIILDWQFALVKEMDIEGINLTEFVEYPLPLPTDEEIQNAFDQAKLNLGTDQEVESVITESNKINFLSSDSNENKFEFEFEFRDLSNEELKGKILGQNKGFEFDFVFTDFAVTPEIFRRHIVSAVAGSEEIIINETILHATVNNITERVAAEENEEFWQNLDPSGAIKDFDGYKNAYQKGFESRFEGNTDLYFFYKFKEGLLNRFSIDLPDTFYKLFFEQVMRLNHHAIEHHFEEQKDNFRWSMIKEKLDAEYGLIPSEIEIKRDIAYRIFNSLGMSSLPNHFIDRYVDDLMKDQKTVNDTANGLYLRKLSKVIREVGQIPIKHVSMDEYNQLIEQLNEELAKLNQHDHDHHHDHHEALNVHEFESESPALNENSEDQIVDFIEEDKV